MKPQGNGNRPVLADLELANYQDVYLCGEGLLPSEKVRRANVQATVERKANWLVLPEKLVDELGLPDVEPFDDRRFVQVRAEVFGRDGLYRALVDPEGEQVVIGQILLGDLDLLIDPESRILRPRHPHYIIAEIG